ncbi:MAG: hypothetical protein HPY78_06785 [Brevinematales bacterium]|nr:hypothetical protein [Brevinematales bacterium]
MQKFFLKVLKRSGFLVFWVASLFFLSCVSSENVKQIDNVYFFMETGDFRTALSQLEKMNQKNVEVLILQGFIFSMLGDEAKAIQIFSQPLIKKKHPGASITAQLFYAKFLIEHQMFDDAEKVVQHILNRDRDNILALYYQGLIYKRKGALTRAVENFSRVLMYTNVIRNANDEIAYIQKLLK